MNKLAIVGTHSATRDQGPFNDPTYDIWVFNEAPQALWCKRWDAVFQLHKPEVYTSENNFVNKEHWDWLQQDHGHKKTVFMQERDERVPCSTRYPLDEIRMMFAAAKMGQFTSTGSMAIALGLYLGYDEIELWGVDLSSNTEYAYQQDGFLFWCGVAFGMIGDGFKLHCALQHFTNRVYGYEGETQIDREYFSKRAELFQAQARAEDNRLRKMTDRISACMLDHKHEDFPDLIKDAQEAAIAAGEAHGSLQEAQSFAERTDPISRQQFERRGATAQRDLAELQTNMDKEFGKVEYVFNMWFSNAYNYSALQQLRVFVSKLLSYAATFGGNQGVANENYRYMNEYDSRVQAAGGERTLTALGVA